MKITTLLQWEKELSLMDNFKIKIKNLKDAGLFSIYFATILSKVITLLGGVLLVRLLNPDDYAIYTLVINAISVLSIWGDLGSADSMLQYVLENKDNVDKQNSIFQFSFKMALIGGGLSSILLLLSFIFYPYKSSTVELYATTLFLVPLLTVIINYFCVTLRAKEQNKKYAYYQLITIILHYAVVIALTLIFGLQGSLYSQYIYNIIVLIIGYFLIKKFFTLKRPSKDNLENKEKKGFMHLAMGFQVNNTISHLLMTLDIFVIGLLVGETMELAYYKVATIIPNALVFLPQCLLIFLTPYFIKNNNNKKWLQDNVKKMIKWGLIGYGLVSLLLIILSKYIIILLYSKEYMPSQLPFIILIISFWLSSSLKIPLSNVIYTLHKVNWNLFISISGLVLNLILNFVFIKIWGAIGAAYSTLLVTFIMGLLNLIYIKKVLNYENLKKNGIN